MVMEELSQSIDTKNLYEHYQLKQVNEDDRQTNYDSCTQHEISLPHSPQEEVVPLHISGLILKRN